MKVLGILGIDTVRTQQSASYITEVAWLVADSERQALLDLKSLKVCPFMFVAGSRRESMAELCKEHPPFLLGCVKEINRLYKTASVLVVYPSKAEFTARVQDEYRRIGKRGINIFGKHDIVSADRVINPFILKKIPQQTEEIRQLIRDGHAEEATQRLALQGLTADQVKGLSYMQIVLLLLLREALVSLPPQVAILLKRVKNSELTDNLLQPLSEAERKLVEKAWKRYIAHPTAIVTFFGKEPPAPHEPEPKEEVPAPERAEPEVKEASGGDVQQDTQNIQQEMALEEEESERTGGEPKTKEPAQKTGEEANTERRETGTKEKETEAEDVLAHLEKSFPQQQKQEAETAVTPEHREEGDKTDTDNTDKEVPTSEFLSFLITAFYYFALIRTQPSPLQARYILKPYGTKDVVLLSAVMDVLQLPYVAELALFQGHKLFRELKNTIDSLFRIAQGETPENFPPLRKPEEIAQVLAMYKDRAKREKDRGEIPDKHKHALLILKLASGAANGKRVNIAKLGEYLFPARQREGGETDKMVTRSLMREAALLLKSEAQFLLKHQRTGRKGDTAHRLPRLSFVFPITPQDSESRMEISYDYERKIIDAIKHYAGSEKASRMLISDTNHFRAFLRFLEDALSGREKEAVLFILTSFAHRFRDRLIIPSLFK